MTRIVRSASWTTLSTFINIAVQILQLAILSRHIETSIFGQYAILNLFIEIFTAVALGGIANYLMYNRKLTSNEKNTVFTLAIIVGILAFVLVTLLAFPILNLMGYPDLLEPLIVLSTLLIMHAVGAQYQSIGLLAFKHPGIAKVEIISRILSFGVAILTIDSGLYCLVFSALSYQLIRLVGIMLILSKLANLGFGWQKEIVKDAIRYGIYDLGGQWLNITRRQIDTIILAALLPLQELGAYHLIKQLASRPAQAIQPIINKMALPILSHARSNIENFKQTYYDLFAIQTMILAIFYAPLIGASEIVTSVIFGEKLMDYHLILALLSLFWFIRVAPSNLMGPLVQVSGKTNLNFYWNLAILPVSGLLMYVSALYGIHTLAISLVLFQLCCVPLAFIFVIKKILNLKIGKIFWLLFAPLVTLTSPMLVLSFFVTAELMDNKLLATALYGLVCAITIVVMLAMHRDFKQSLRRIKHYNMG